MGNVTETRRKLMTECRHGKETKGTEKIQMDLKKDRKRTQKKGHRKKDRKKDTEKKQ